MFYLIGLGLGDAKDITVKGLEVVKNAERVYLEAYTSILTVGKEELESFYGRSLIVADRNLVEQEADLMLEDSDKKDIAFLVVGDPFGATTHTDLVTRAIQKGIQFKVIHNASILNAAGCCGLQLYNFGETVSIVMWQDDWKPESFYDKIIANKSRGLHTLCLLDIKMKEQSVENLMKGNKIFEPPRFLSCNNAIRQLLEISERRNSDEQTGIGPNTFCIGLARIGWDTQNIVAASMLELKDFDLGPPIHSLIIPGEMHFLEAEMVNQFALKPESN